MNLSWWILFIIIGKMSWLHQSYIVTVQVHIAYFFAGVVQNFYSISLCVNIKLKLIFQQCFIYKLKFYANKTWKWFLCCVCFRCFLLFFWHPDTDLLLHLIIVLCIYRKQSVINFIAQQSITIKPTLTLHSKNHI